MASFSDELINSSEQIVERWYETWSRSSHPHRDVSEKLLKDSLAAQFRLIGEQLKNLSTAEAPEMMWKLVSRLDPEARIAQKILIEEVVQQYRIAVDVVRSWVQERGINVAFAEYSYFYRALFELTAEAVRRYSAEQANIVSGERARPISRKSGPSDEGPIVIIFGTYRPGETIRLFRNSCRRNRGSDFRAQFKTPCLVD